ncbi:MAG: PASTA domain-containing protein [Bacteroides sp.]|nr:PASTA domain-containing protein [Bacteroides sp.]
MIATVAIIIFIVFKWMDSYTRHGQAITVPDVQGMDVKSANSLFAEHGLQGMVTDSTYVKDKKPGAILDQIPPSGNKVKEGRIIYLTVNTRSVPMIEVPDVADNSSYRQAEARMLAAGFKLTAPEKITGETDWVYGVKYRGQMLHVGEKVPLEATLTLVIGDGTASSQVEGDTLEDYVPPVQEPEVQVDRIWF